MTNSHIDPIRWRQIEDVFTAVVEAPPAERDDRLRALCGSDAALAAEVAGLLASDARFGTHVASVPGVHVSHTGLRLGHYQVDELIARGGMGAVYRAHRADDQFRHHVAVKVVDQRLSGEDLAARFRVERQILAGLEHPNITRLLDGGVTDNDEPYLVMELLDGKPITEFADAGRLDIEARVRLFLQVCTGVAYAHRSLVLHRDLKPSNILVTADGQAKIVDFGTATLLEPERLATTSRAPLTPAYASPEQLTGRAVGTSSDQYSLGLVLYELLCGTTPFGQRTSLIMAIERALAGAEVAAPAEMIAEGAAEVRGTSRARLRRQLGGDLGTIMRKAVSQDPASRYASVSQFADDLERWLAGQPIVGRPPSFTYEAARFVGRHRVAVGVAAALFLSLLAATATSVYQARVARTESSKTRQLNSFLTSMLSSANPMWTNANAARAGSITVREVLDGASQQIASELSGSPDVEAEMRRTLGSTYIGLGVVDRAAEHLDRAIELDRAIGNRIGEAKSQIWRCHLLMLRAQYQEAETLCRQTLVEARVFGPAADPQFFYMAVSDLSTAISFQRPGDEESLTLMREVIDAADRYQLNSGGVAVVTSNLAHALVRLGRLDEAEAALRESKRRFDAMPSPPVDRGYMLRLMSAVSFHRGDYVEAERLAGEALEFILKHRPVEHPHTPYFQSTWGRALVATGQLERARKVLADSLAHYQRMRPPGHFELVYALVPIGALERAEGRLQESERVLREARKILLENPAQKDSSAGAAGELGLTLRALGRTAEADALLKESYDQYRELFGESHPLTRLARSRLE